MAGSNNVEHIKNNLKSVRKSADGTRTFSVT